MFKVYEMMGNFSKEVAIFETESDAADYLNERWDESRADEMLHNDDMDEDDVRENFLSYFSIENDGRELIDYDDLVSQYDDMLDECYPEVFGISPSRILNECDKIQYDCGLNDYYDSISGEYYCEDME